MSNEPILVQALYAFNGTNNDELCFKKGDIITITQQDEGWWEGTLGGTTGWFPSNYIREIKEAPQMVGAVRTSEADRREYQAIVLKDMIDSEQAHVSELQGLVDNFLHPLEKSTILTDDEFKQLTSNINEILEVHVELLNALESEQTMPYREQKVGRLFMNLAIKIKNVHQNYCSQHPRAVCILDKFKDDLTRYMESLGAAIPGILVLTTGLSKPFRRLDKYSGMLLELERHVDEGHPDRGDTQRSVAVYKDIAATCAAIRRQKELELQVLTGPVRGWEGQSLISLGDIIYMGSVAIGLQHLDRYLVLFQSTLLMLSVSHRLSAFIYEGKLPLTGISIVRLEDCEQYKNGFEINGPMIEKVTAVCQSRDEANHWVEILRNQNPTVANLNRSSMSNVAQKILPSQAEIIPQPPPHLNQRGYCTRTSVVQFLPATTSYLPSIITYPNQYYPAASPYYALSKLYSKLIKERVITRQLLKNLLYPEYTHNKCDLSAVKRRRHRSELIIFNGKSNRVSIINCDSESDSDSDSSCTDSTSADDKTSSSCSSGQKRLQRQNALDKPTQESSSSSISSNPFGYIRYYNPKTCNREELNTFVDYGTNCFDAEMVTDKNSKSKNPSVVLTSVVRLKLTNQLSENSDVSSVVTARPFGACENLLNIDGSFDIGPIRNLQVPASPLPERQSCPTKLVADKFNESSLTTIYIPQCQSSGEIKYKTFYSDREAKSSSSSTTNTTTHSSSIDVPINPLPLPDNIVTELLYNFDGNIEVPPAEEDVMEANVLQPPEMFQNDDKAVKTKALPLAYENIGFRKHSINLDKPQIKRRSSIHLPQLRKCSSYHAINDNTADKSTNYCRCCTEPCHSPRSSDSGMAGSCTLNSPDLARNDYASDLRSSIHLENLYGLKHYQGGGNRNVISLTDIDSKLFEAQCRCTSPFGSTPRTSYPTATTTTVDETHSQTMTAVLRNTPPPHPTSTNPPVTSSPSIPTSHSHPLLSSLQHRPDSTLRNRVTVSDINSKPAWSLHCLRVAAPWQPCTALTSGATGAVTRYSNAHKQQSTGGGSYKDDAMILEVIEAYCNVAVGRTRNTVNSVDLLTGGNVRMHDKLSGGGSVAYRPAQSRSSMHLDRSASPPLSLSSVVTPLYPHRYRPHNVRASTWCCGSFVLKQLRKTQ